MLSKDEEFLWAFKMYMLDEISSSKMLSEGLTSKKINEFKNYVRNLKIEQIFEAVKGDSPFDYDVDSPLSLDQLHKDLKGALGDHKPKAKNIPAGDTGKKKYELEKVLTKDLGERYGIDRRILFAVGIGLAAIIGIVAYLIYKRYHDICRKQCKGSTDPNCVKRCKTNAIKQTILKLQQEKSKCGRDEKCKIKFDKQLNKWGEKLKKL